MVKAVVFDMFETLVSLFHGKTYFSENIAADLGIEQDVFRGPWHATEPDRTLGLKTMEEGVGEALRELGKFSEDNVKMIRGKVS